MFGWLKRVWRGRTLAEELADWTLFSLRNDVTGQKAVVRLRIARPPGATGAFRTAVRIGWAYAGELPREEDNRAQLRFEEAIDALTGGNGHAELVQVATGGGLKEWLFYCVDEPRFTAELNRLLAGHPEYPLQIAHRDDPDWDMWRELVETLKRKGS